MSAISSAISSRSGGLRRLAEPPLLALGFLTIIPVNVPWAIGPRSMGRAAALFPAVGLLLGVVVALADVGLRQALPIGTASGLDLVFLVVLSGALHLDGLMDWCDGIVLSGGSQRRLSVMRDSRVGGFGVLGGVLALLLEYSALSSLSGPARTSALLLVPTVARWTMVLLIWTFPYVRANGTGTAFKEGLGIREVLVATALCVLPVAVRDLRDLLIILVAATVALFLGWWTARRLGGLTGDAYGAGCEAVAVVLFVFLAGGWG